MHEHWKEIPWAPEYQVSNLGRAKRLQGYRCRKERILKPRTVKDGYLSLHICHGGVRSNLLVHRIVCELFNGKRPGPEYQIAHNDGVKTNNIASNLRWATAKENARDRDLHGTTARGDKSGARRHPNLIRRGENSPTAKLNTADVIAIRRHQGLIREICKQFGVSKSTVERIRRRSSWAHVPAEALLENAEMEA